MAYIDHYGNAITGLRAGALDNDAVLIVNGYQLKHARTFSAMTGGVVYWYENANGLVEFAMNRGRADAAIGIRVGATFTS